MTQKEIDWMKWAGIEPNSHDKILTEAKKMGVPVFDGDTSKEIFDRLLAAKAIKANRYMVYLNVGLTITTVISALVAVLSYLGKK